MKRALLITLIVLSLAPLPSARAADHADGPLASQDPSADITDVFAWMSADARKVYLVVPRSTPLPTSTCSRSWSRSTSRS